MKYWIRGPKTIWNNLPGARFYFQKLLHPNLVNLVSLSGAEFTTFVFFSSLLFVSVSLLCSAVLFCLSQSLFCVLQVSFVCLILSLVFCSSLLIVSFSSLCSSVLFCLSHSLFCVLQFSFVCLSLSSFSIDFLASHPAYMCNIIVYI